MTDEELDIVIAEKVMGWTTRHMREEMKSFHPSTSIADAWLALKRAEQVYLSRDWNSGYWKIALSNWGIEPAAEVEADTAPHAICLALLQIVESQHAIPSA